MSQEFNFVESEVHPGLSVIEASAGTGKTYAISHLVPRLLLDGTASSLGEVLLVTFTKDAARELSDRVRRVLEKLQAPPGDDEPVAEPGVHRLRQKYAPGHIADTIGQALLDLDRLRVSTIHSFCQRTLQSEGTLCGLPVVPDLIADASDLIDQALYDLWEKKVAADELCSAVATVMKWDLADDLKFVHAAMALEEVEMVPAPGDFSENLRALDGFAATFTEAVCGELAEFFGQVGRWTKAGEVADRDRLLELLQDAKTAADPGFLEAVRQIAGAPGWINRQSKIGKELNIAVAGCSAVELAGDVVKLLSRLQWDFRRETIGEIRSIVVSSVRANRQITYDGLIESLAVALRGDHARALASRLRHQYKVALIDESQDTDARQFEIFRKVFVGLEGEDILETHRLVLIGDPKQAIYAFRGADVNTYLSARVEAGGQIFRLTKTYRAPESLVQAVNSLFGSEGSLLKEGLGFPDGSSGIDGDVQLELSGQSAGARMEVWCAPDEGGEDYATAPKRLNRIAGTVATEIARILKGNPSAVRTTSGGERTEKPINPGDIAVLVNSHWEAEVIAGELSARSVPAIRAGTQDVMASAEAGELLVLLRAIHDPRRSSLRLAALATRLLGKSLEQIRILRDDSEKDDENLQCFLAWQEEWHRRGIASALARIDEQQGVTTRLARLEQGERRITNLRQIFDLLQAASLELSRRPGHLVRWLSQEISRASGRSSAEERMQQLESDADAVQIVTMHSAKGLEYSLVFCPFLWTGREPTGVQKLSRPGRIPQLVDMDLNEDSAITAEILRAALEDRLRLAYVAITRAKVKVWIYCGEIAGSRKRPASAMDWLLRSDEAEYSDEWRNLVGGGGRGSRHAASWEILCANAKTVNSIACIEPPLPNEDKWEGSQTEMEAALTPLTRPVIPAAWGMTSFSALTREKNPHGGIGSASPERSAVGPEGGGGNLFLGAQGGALVGTAVHDWIEGWDFSETKLEPVANHLAKYPLSSGPEKSPLPQAVFEMLEILRSVELPGLGCSVQEACPLAQSSEWHFQLPIGQLLSSTNLAEAFEQHGQADYAAILSALPGEQLAGYLHGFLDRIAFHDGAWGVIDWKTNYLGPSPADYDQSSLEACAWQSHYLLQTHLYLVALRRYLGPDVPIAGAWLIFLRGIREDTAEGVLQIQPSEALMEALDALFAQPAEVATS